MSRIIGIIGLPNVGKSTIFNTLTNSHAPSSNYPFCTIEPNIGVVDVPDERLIKLKELIRAKEVTPTTIKFMDLAGLIKGSSQGEGLGNRFLASAREADVLLHVVRCFEDPDITHIEKEINPERDIDIINIELCLSDLEMVEKRLGRLDKIAKSGDRDAREEVSCLEKIREFLRSGEIIKKRDFFKEKDLEGLPLLTLKPVIYLANIGDKDSGRGNDLVERISRKVSHENAVVITVEGRLEDELRDLREEEKDEFRKTLMEGRGSPLKKLIEACYEILGLITFYTTLRDKLSAWSIKEGEKILKAAGKIHTDMQEGFIRADVINFKEFVDAGSYNAARVRGCLRSVGKDYSVQDGDIIYILFKIKK